MKPKSNKPKPVKVLPSKPAPPVKRTGKCIAAEVGCGQCPCGGPDCGHHLGLNPN